MPLRFHNTLSGQLEEFSPLSPREVKMYNCGPTVYDRQHIGNMFAVVFADTLRRTLGVWGYKVKQVINITDFGHLSGGDVGDDETEDKMTQGLAREGMKPTLENMRKLVYAFYNPKFSFKQVIEKYPDAAGDITDCLAGDVNKDFSSLWKKISEFVPLPDDLPVGEPLAL